MTSLLPTFEIDVAVPTPVHGSYTYLHSEPLPAGTRVLVPFGARSMIGVAMGYRNQLESKEKREFSLKGIREVIDREPAYSTTMLELAAWISTYYMHPLGEVLRAMLPASTNKVARSDWAITPAGLAARTSDAEVEATLKALFGKKTSLAEVTWKKRLAASTGLSAAAAALAERGLIANNRSNSQKARRTDEDQSLTIAPPASEAQAAPPLTATQQAALHAMITNGLDASEKGCLNASGPAAPKPFLLLGVTGSGKTEVYLNLITAALERSSTGNTGAQTIVLVPEISLTPQMTRVFEKRFPGKVAVVHSAMTDVERWEQLERMRSGTAAILIGPRSAIFGPCKNLKLIIVDEEHDGSYKQTSGLNYHGRDVAVVRGKLEGCTVVLGSATPSMESYNNALSGKYHLLELPERVTGRPLPEVESISGDNAFKKGVLMRGGIDAHAPAEAATGKSLDGHKDLPISQDVINALTENLARNQQSIVLVNRRGYAYYLYSLEKRQPLQCPQCSISMTLHKRSTELRCHYCDYRTAVSKVIHARSSETFVAIGYGSEKAEDCIRAEVAGARVVRIDSDTVLKRDVLPETLNKFRDREIDILVGTQILAKGHDFPNVTLIAILEVDQLLSLPDFRAGERTFQLIVQAAGRAGRADLPGKVLIQCSRIGHPVIQLALEQNFKAFASKELEFRKTHGYPPYGRMIALEFTSEDPAKITRFCTGMETWLESAAQKNQSLYQHVRILGPAVPPIETIRGRHRRTVIFASAAADALRLTVAAFVEAHRKLPGDLRLRIDVDPQSLI